MDQREQRGLTIAALAKLVQHNGLWVVPSPSTPTKSYLVTLAELLINPAALWDLAD